MELSEKKQIFREKTNNYIFSAHKKNEKYYQIIVSHKALALIWLISDQ